MVNITIIKLIVLSCIIMTLLFIVIVDADYRPVRGNSISSGECSVPVDWANQRQCVLKKSCDTCINSYMCTTTNGSSYYDIITNCDGSVISFREEKPAADIVPGISNFTLVFFGMTGFFIAWVFFFKSMRWSLI